MTEDTPAGSALTPLQPAPNLLSPKELQPWPQCFKLKDTILVYPEMAFSSSPDHGPNFLGLIIMAVSLEPLEITTTATVRGLSFTPGIGTIN